MKTLTVQVPEALLDQTGSSEEALTRETQFLLALKFFELGRLTSGQAAEMCNLNRVDFLVAAGKAGVPVADLDGEELSEEIRNASRR
jgi:predicted HTH domain antitoxin